MTYASVTTQRAKDILALLQSNPRFKNAHINIEPINGSGDYQFEIKGTTKLGAPRKVIGIVKKNESINHLKEII